RVELHGDVDQAEADRPAPDCSCHVALLCTADGTPNRSSIDPSGWKHHDGCSPTYPRSAVQTASSSAARSSSMISSGACAVIVKTTERDPSPVAAMKCVEPRID